MKKKNKTLIILMLILSNINFAQEFNGYKYIIVDNTEHNSENDIFVCGAITNYFRTKGYEVFVDNEGDDTYAKLEFRKCEGLVILFDIEDTDIELGIYNCKMEYLKKYKKDSNVSVEKSLKSLFKELDLVSSYSFNENLLPKFEIKKIENINKDETELKSYFDSTKLDLIEGIYKSYKSNSNFKIGIIKDSDKYKAMIIESDIPSWQIGDVKVIFESTAVESVFTVKYFSDDLTSIEEGFANLEGGLITIEIKELDKINLLKLYPKK